MKPFLRWAGGKRALSKTLAARMPRALLGYYEPFLGGGALFFRISNRVKKAYLSDINGELISSFNSVKERPDIVVDLVGRHEQNHSKEYFGKIRDGCAGHDQFKISARFLYINKYSFRGIYRLSPQGKCTCSYSDKKYKKSNNESIYLASLALQKATIAAQDFTCIKPKGGDFVYFDPPYLALSKGLYTKEEFGCKDHIRLYKFACKLARDGVRVMISSSDNEFIRDLYKGFAIERVQTSYAMRFKDRSASELIITNYI